MDWNTLSSLSEHGWEVASHTRTHAQLDLLRENEAREEIAGSKAALEDHLGRAVHSFCYPYGRYNRLTPLLVEEAGFTGACTTLRGWATESDLPLLLPRVSVTRRRFPLFLYRFLKEFYARPHRAPLKGATA